MWLRVRVRGCDVVGSGRGITCKTKSRLEQRRSNYRGVLRGVDGQSWSAEDDDEAVNQRCSQKPQKTRQKHVSHETPTFVQQDARLVLIGVLCRLVHVATVGNSCATMR